jgi:hypothetical protein
MVAAGAARAAAPCRAFFGPARRNVGPTWTFTWHNRPPDVSSGRLEDVGYASSSPIGRSPGRISANYGELIMLGTILLIILILILLGALPTWPYSSGWGYYPSGGVSLILIIVVVLLLAGRI